MQTELKNYLYKVIFTRKTQENLSAYERILLEIAEKIIEAYKNNHRVYLIGNGGSASQAIHISAELSGRFELNRPALPAEALCSNPAAMTAIANDFGYENVFSRQVEAFVDEGDILIGLTTSGNSVNLINAFKVAKEKKAITIAFTNATGGDIAALSDIVLYGPDKSVGAAIIQELHLTAGHIICGLVERAMYAE